MENPPIAHLEGSSQPHSDQSGKVSLGSQGSLPGQTEEECDDTLTTIATPTGKGLSSVSFHIMDAFRNANIIIISE